MKKKTVIFMSMLVLAVFPVLSTERSDTLFMLEKQGVWYVALETSQKGDTLSLVVPFSQMSDTASSNSDRVVSISEAGLSLYHGIWYLCGVLEKKRGRYLVRYHGYDSSWDTWVDSDDYIPALNLCEVLWQDEWYPAIVADTDGSSWFIRYINYEDDWDEWVDEDRIHFLWP